MSLFSKEYPISKKEIIPRPTENQFLDYFRDMVCNTWIAPSAALLFTHACLKQRGQRDYLLTIAGGALRDAYFALKYLSYIKTYSNLHEYTCWDIFWDFMYYWVKDYDIWVHINPQKTEDKNPQNDAQLLETYCRNIYNSSPPLLSKKSITNAYEDMYSHFYTNYPSPLKHAEKISKYFESPDNFLPCFSNFGTLHSVKSMKLGEYENFLPEGISHLLKVDIPSPYLLDEKHIGSYVSRCSYFLPNTPVPMSIQIMLTTKTPTELLSSFDWNINRFGWTINPFNSSVSVMWNIPKSPFQFQYNSHPNVGLLQFLMRLANLATKYSIVPLEMQRKYPKIAWRTLLQNIHKHNKIRFQLSDDFLYEIICQELFNDSNR